MDDNRPRPASGPEASEASANAPKIQQPKPQALPSRSGPSAILVSPRQKGNPILNGVRSIAWEYSDIPADYVLGATTCALFLSLKYHRLHPEYVYNRIRDLKGQYTLRILLTMVDIENHEEPLRELSKTSLINNVTIILCWSAQEAGRYLELFKSFEHTAPTSIRAQQATSYADQMVEFITVPRSINKTDALGLYSNFGSVRTAVNASPEEIGLIAGWGEKKVQRWCNAVREPFRIKRAAKRGHSSATPANDASRAEGEEGDMVDEAMPDEADADKRPSHRLAEDGMAWQVDEAAEAMRQTERALVEDRPSTVVRERSRPGAEEEMSEGIMSALSKLRQP
ncbi:mating-type switching protein swi10 [Sporormia fimetaria CBS 119925]|uniref:Mating-type switching protein swi10 n=1 Tax=Sporormia fimetaria CBS 119925 TaxID=1340428 RepID=A0A6A6V9J2_9PLEO|nr:mating-type switching protein swi10 [Sporormia fimetaria CBS 119925]